MILRFAKLIDGINEYVGRTVALLLPILMLEVVFGAVARYGFNHPFVWTQDVACFIYGIILIGSGGYALLHKSHVNVEVIYAKLSDRSKALLDLITAPLFFFFAILLFWESLDMAIDAIETREHLATAWHGPVYPFKALVPLGALLLLLQGISKAINDIGLVRTSIPEKD